MDMMTELVEIKLASFEEAVEKPVWVDDMVEEYDSIVRKNVWEVVPKFADKLVVGLRWIYKVKQEADESVDKHRTRFVAIGFSQME